MPAKGILITGTGTGVGKTFVGCGLARALRARGLAVAPFKPAETGCEPDPSGGELLPQDAALLKEAAQSAADLEVICPYRFRMPAAPWVASRQEGRRIDPAVLARRYDELAAMSDVVIVETAGGILVPLTERVHYGDLAQQLKLPVLVVAGSALGVINHTLLTVDYLRSYRLKLLGVVLNHTSGDRSPAVETNEDALHGLLDCPMISIPFSSAVAGGAVGELVGKKPFEELAEVVAGDLAR